MRGDAAVAMTLYINGAILEINFKEERQAQNNDNKRRENDHQSLSSLR